MKGIELALNVCHIVSTCGKACYKTGDGNKYTVFCNDCYVADVDGYKVRVADTEAVRNIFKQNSVSFLEEDGKLEICGTVSKKVLSEVFKAARTNKSSG